MKDIRTVKDKISLDSPKIILLFSFLIALVFIYGFILWTFRISLSSSTLMPVYDWVGFMQYKALFQNERWWTACRNIISFGGLMIFGCISLGLLLAIFLDQKIRAEGVLRTVYLYPMALSFIVTGVAWKWILNPGLGFEKLFKDIGFSDFTFDWIITPEKAIYTVAIAGIWQSTGFVMALFLARLRRVDDSIISAAKLEGATMPAIYRRIIIPSMGPTFFSVILILSHLIIKSFDLVVALTNGGPGYATDLPAVFMYAHTFARNEIAFGSSSSIILLGGVLGIMVPYIYSSVKKRSYA